MLGLHLHKLLVAGSLAGVSMEVVLGTHIALASKLVLSTDILLIHNIVLVVIFHAVILAIVVTLQPLVVNRLGQAVLSHVLVVVLLG